MGLRQVEQGLFSSFFAKFLAYLMIFQRFAAPSVGTNHFGKSSNMAKTLAKKALFNLPFKNPFLHAGFGHTRSVTSSNSSNRRRDPHELRYELRSPTFGLCSITILVLYKSLKKVIGLWCVLPSIYATMVFSTPMSIQTQLLGT